MGTDGFLEVMHELAAFVRVADAGSFSAAARVCGQTPSALSRQLTRLERALGVTLLRRNTRSLTLTDAGAEVLAHGRQMVAAAQASLAVAAGHHSAPAGRLRLSAPKAFARHLLDAPLIAFLHANPDVDIELMVTDRPVDLIREHIDVAIRLTDEPSPGVVARALFPVRQLLLASQDYLARHALIDTPHALPAHSCLTIGEAPGDRLWRFARGETQVSVTVGGRFAANHSEMRLSAIEAGLGVGCVPDFVARDALADGRVVRVLADWQFDTNYQGTAYLLYARDRHAGTALRALLAHLTATLQAKTANPLAPDSP